MKTAFDPSKSVALVASAGTGKTYSLTIRVLTLLLNGTKPEDILCITFTNKATAEMKERIYGRVEHFANGELAADDPLIGEADTLKENTGLNDNDFISRMKTIRDLLLESHSKLQIKTVQSFVNMMLSMFPFEAGLRPGYEVGTEEAIKDIKETAFSNIFMALEKGESAGLFEKLRTSLGFKTTYLPVYFKDMLDSLENKHIEISKILYQYNPDLDEIYSILDSATVYSMNALQYAKDFASEMEKHKLNGNQKKQIAKIGKITYFDDLLSVTYFLNNDHISGYYKKFEHTAEITDLYYKTSENIKNFLQAKGESIVNISLMLYKKYYEELIRIKEQKNLITFSDIITRGYELMVLGGVHDDRDYFYFRLDGKLLHILMDEFQDTSIPDWLILKPLAEEAMAGIGAKDELGSFFYVGDPKQTLYRFRGGQSWLFDVVKESFGEKITLDTLQTNYRSTKEIVELTNSIFLGLYDNLIRPGYFPKQTANSKETGYISICPYDEKNRENFVLESVKKSLEHGYSPNDIAVLVEQNKRSVKIAEVLLSEGINVRAESNESLCGSMPYVAITSLLKYIDTLNDLYLHKFLFAYPAVTAEESVSKETAIIKNILEKEILSHEYLNIYKLIVEISEIFALPDRFINDPNYSKLMDLAASCPEKGINKFLNSLDQMAESIKSSTTQEENAVSIMTIHKSKGLQFPIVIIPELKRSLNIDSKKTKLLFQTGESEFYADNILFHHSKSYDELIDEDIIEAREKENSRHITDSLNLLYVAMTRAEKAIFMAVNEKISDHLIDSLIPEMYRNYETISGLPKLSDASSNKSLKRKIRKFNFEKLEDYEDIEEDDKDNFMAETYGSSLHEAVFLSPSFDENGLSSALETVKINNGIYLPSAQIDKIKEDVLSLYDNPDFISLVSSGSVFREKQFMDQGRMKIIDLYVVKEDHVTVVDFKTGEMTDESLEKHEEQLNEYSDILKTLYSKPVRKVVIHIRDGKTEFIYL